MFLQNYITVDTEKCTDFIYSFTLWRLTTFDIVYSMTSGGPGEDTALIAYRITTEAFTNLNVGYASALAMLLFVVMAVFSWLNIHVMNKIDN